MSEFDQDKNYQELHKQYQAQSNELPPEHLDASILAAAHEAVEQEQTGPVMGVDTQPVKRAWYVPVSYVAVLVISLSVVMKLALEPTVERVEPLTFNGALEESLEPMADAGGVAVPEIAQMRAAMPVEKPQKTMAAMDPSAEAKKRAVMPQRSKQQVSSAMPASAPVAETAGLALMGQMEKESMADASADQQIMASQMRPPLSQDDWIAQLEQLFKTKKFEQLRKSLKQYREHYPLIPGQERLSAELRAWEKLDTEKIDNEKMDKKKNDREQ